MRSSVIAFFLCACTAALGQCVAPGVAPTMTPAVASVSTTRPETPARPAPELITAAGAVTHDAVPTMKAAPPRSSQASGERPRRAGPAMLLAALAVMSGIALRRYSARDQ